MIDRRKNGKDLAEIAYDTYKDFAENTSIHGLKYTVKRDVVVYEKVFWIVVVLAGLCGAGYMTVLFWNRYTSNPTRTSIKTAYAPNTAVPFPAITLCNINRIMANQVDAFVEELTTAEAPEKILIELYSKIGFNPSSIILTWEKIPIGGVFLEFLIFVMHVNVVRASRREKFCSRIFHTTLSNSRIIAIRVMIHSPWDYPGSGSMYKIVSAGRQSYLQVTASKIICSSDIKRLPIEQRQCAYGDEVQLKYFQRFSDTNCLSECEERYLYKRCGCIPFYYPFSKRSVCNITRIPCLDESIGTTLVNVTKTCNCPSQCEDIFYSVLSSTATLAKADAAPTSAFLANQNVTENSVVLYIYFSGDRQTILFRDIITSTIYLLSSFGGVYSLFLGCSFITIVEIIYYSTFRLIVNLKIVGRLDKTVTKVKKDEPKAPKGKLWTFEHTYLN